MKEKSSSKKVNMMFQPDGRRSVGAVRRGTAERQSDARGNAPCLGVLHLD